MRNAPNNPKAEGSAGGTCDYTGRAPRAANLTPRSRRLLVTLLAAPQTRENVDRITGASNGPDEVMRLRRRFNLLVPCTRKGAKDRDGHHVEFGTYSLTATDRAKALELLARGEAQ